jgi:hypothetical protein
MEVQIDEYQFISMPCLMSKPQPAAAAAAEHDDDDLDDGADTTAAAATAIATTSAATATNAEEKKESKQQQQTTSMTTQSAAPTTAAAAASDEQKKKNDNNSSSSSSSSKAPTTTTTMTTEATKKSSFFIDFFNIVIVVQRADATLLKMYREIVRKLARVFIHEQRRCNFLNAQAEELLQIRTAYEANLGALREKSDKSSSNSDSGSTVDNNNNNAAADSNADINNGNINTNSSNEESLDRGAFDFTELVSRCTEKSVLARHLRDVRNGLHHRSNVHIVVNDLVDVHLTLQTGLPRDANGNAYMPKIYPYQSVLLNKGVSRMLASLPLDASPQLRLFLKHAHPTKSFESLSMTLGVPLSQLFLLATHLVIWHKARVIDTICDHQMYVITPGLMASKRIRGKLARLEPKFAALFPPFTLTETLCQFSRHKTLQEHASRLNSNARAEFIRVLSWFLRHQFVTPLHRYIHCIAAPNNARRALLTTTELEEREREEKSSATSPTSVKQLFMKKAQRRAHEALFKRLRQYFDGKHSVTDIMWKASVTVAQIEALLRAYPDTLVELLH